MVCHCVHMYGFSTLKLIFSTTLAENMAQECVELCVHLLFSFSCAASGYPCPLSRAFISDDAELLEGRS